MNKQLKTENGVIISRGIEWADYTENPTGGCEHDCEWAMPDGEWAECYAKTVAERLAQNAYPHGFKHHYWHPDRLKNFPKAVLTPVMRAGSLANRPAQPMVFVDSMADLFGNWVPEEQVNQVLDAIRECPNVVFQSLTKNSPRILKFNLPPNLWVGVSAPPTKYKGHILTLAQQHSFVIKQLDTLLALKWRGHPICWMSIEPLSFDIAAVFREWIEDDKTRANPTGLPLDWAVIGAASNGPKYFQPDPEHVKGVHGVLLEVGAKIFHKGNLKWTPHLEEFPQVKSLKQEALI